MRGDLLLDPFLGSGSSLIAAERVGRICRGVEIDPLYVDVAIRRWQRLTGERAIHAASGVALRRVGRTENGGERCLTRIRWPAAARREKGSFSPDNRVIRAGVPKAPKISKTYLREELVAKITVIEHGKPRKISKAQAIAIQLVNKASVGDPKGLAAVVALTREYDETLPDERLNVLQRAEDTVVIEGICPGFEGSGRPRTLSRARP